MKIHFLGTNGWYSSPTGDTPCVLIDSKDHYVIFDAGNGIYKIDKYIKEDKPISLFLSHFHIDHIEGLHILNKFKFKQGIDVYFAKGRKKDFDLFVNPPYTVGITKNKKNIYELRTKIKIHGLEEEDTNIGFPVKMKKLYHGYENHGFRIILEGKSIVYSGDTKICSNSLLLAKGADLLIHECSNIVSSEKDEWGHTDPIQTAQFASDAGVNQLVMTHFGASLYETLEKRKKAEKIAQKIFPNTIAARDGLILRV
ncbi:MAG: seceted metal-dependent hydrolase [uncultured bacterium]|nr:MAG: seceted metal-dependent hydrolase [uncultured bacterium]